VLENKTGAFCENMTLTNREPFHEKTENVVAVRGGGDLATGVIHRLCRCGYHVLILECSRPSAIRRKVAFCEAVYQGQAEVEGIICTRITDIRECKEIWDKGQVPLLVDETGACIKELQPAVLVDAIIAKKNLGTTRDMAPLTIGLGPGFTAGEDVDLVIETKRGHDLGRIIEKGMAVPDTGIPGLIKGVGKDRVIHSPAAGRIKNVSKIADLVQKDQVIACVGETPVKATITGVLRGLIREGYQVPLGMKIADIDPREEEQKNCFTISDKARCIAGGVLEALMWKGVRP
jgi:xanthine dehydrogenase accessory factor